MWQTGRQSSVTKKVIFRETGNVFPRETTTWELIAETARNETKTLTKNIFQVRANFSGPKGSLGNNLQSSVGVKRLTKAKRAEVPAQGAIGQRASTKRRALFASEADLAVSTGEELTNADPDQSQNLFSRQEMPVRRRSLHLQILRKRAYRWT